MEAEVVLIQALDRLKSSHALFSFAMDVKLRQT
jgi:hypothetical protein